MYRVDDDDDIMVSLGRKKNELPIDIYITSQMDAFEGKL